MASEARNPKRVILADDKREVRSALRLLLDQETDMQVVAEANSVDSLLVQSRTSKPDLVMFAWELPANSLARTRTAPLGTVITDLRRASPDASVVVLGNWPELAVDALAAGADAFVSKVDPPERVLRALRGG